MKPTGGERYVVTDEGQPVGYHHVENLLARGGCLHLVHVEFHLMFSLVYRNWSAVASIRHGNI